MRGWRRRWIGSWVILGLLASIGLGQRKFEPDDPLWVDNDRLSIPKPRPNRLSATFDFVEHTFLQKADVSPTRAVNINTLSGVPDSSWYTNRMSRQALSVQALGRGPDRGAGPDVSSTWKIIAAKSEGITPGFTIRDGRGDVYYIKFDSLEYPQLTTSAEVISTKFFHAFGYNVPENYLAFIRPEQLEPAPQAELRTDRGASRGLSRKALDAILNNVPRRTDGTLQALASLEVPGEPLGPFRYYGTREDDPNDIFPHEDRRELRGLQVFSSWLNHTEADSVNTLTTYVREGGGYVKHYLIDFGTTLGSGGVGPHSDRYGNEYYLEWGPALKSALTLGIWDRSWRGAEYPDYPSVGRFEAEHFHPARWRTDYPNPAFGRMTRQDAFWATRIVMRFDAERVRAIVAQGRLSDPEAESYLVETLLKRRDKIVRHYLNQVNPLDEFQVVEKAQGGRLSFANLGLRAGLAAEAVYEYEWFDFDNESGRTVTRTLTGRSPQPLLPIPPTSSPYVLARIKTVSPKRPNWAKTVEVYLRLEPKGPVLVGVEYQ